MPSITLNLNVENAPNPARKHFEKTNITGFFTNHYTIITSIDEEDNREEGYFSKRYLAWLRRLLSHEEGYSRSIEQELCIGLNMFYYITRTAFIYYCPDCQSCPANALQMGVAT